MITYSAIGDLGIKSFSSSVKISVNIGMFLFSILQITFSAVRFLEFIPTFQLRCPLLYH